MSQSEGAVWIGIVSNLEDVKDPKNRTWWCLPVDSAKGDTLYLYCPRSVSEKFQGILGSYKVSVAPDFNSKKQYYCSGYGGGFSRIRYGYTEISFQKQFPKRLQAKEMKRDSVLKSANFVRRNFQGTAFKMSEEAVSRIDQLLRIKNKES